MSATKFVSLSNLTEFLSKVQDWASGQFAAASHTHTKSQITDFPSTMTPSSHTHGNIQNGGALQTNDITIANGDKLVVTDSSDSSKVARASVAFDGSTTSKFLSQKGTWETPAGGSGTVTGVTAGAGLNTTSGDTATDGGTISTSGTLYLTKSGVSANSYGPSADASPGHSGNFKVPYVTVDKYGRVTAAADKTITLPASGNTDAKAKQTSINTNADYPILLKKSANATEETNNVNATNLTSGTAVSINPSTGNITATKLNGVSIGSSPKFTDTNTHRPIQVNGTQNLGDNTTALNLKNGSNVSITADGGNVTIAATDTTYSAEKGISLSSGKFGHSNTAITAQTTQAVYPIKIDAYGHITAYGSAVTSMTPSSHTHGNIQNGGTLQTNDITIASGDKLVVTDSSDSSKIARASISFDGSTTTQFLSKKGTFETPSVSVTIDENTEFNISGTTFKIALVS